jgi:hypothetical protein
VQATGFSNSEEDETCRSALVPFLLEDRIKEVHCFKIQIQHLRGHQPFAGSPAMQQRCPMRTA